MILTEKPSIVQWLVKKRLRSFGWKFEDPVSRHLEIERGS